MCNSSYLHRKQINFTALVAVGAAASAMGVLDVPAVHAGEPSGGRWKPVVLPTANSVAVAGPVMTWRGLKTESEELLAYQKKRTAATTATVRFWDRQGVIRWNEIARQLVINRVTPPPRASRVYALLSVAQYDALVAAWNYKYKYNRAAPSRWNVKIKPQVALEDDPTYPSEDAVVAGASAAVLKYLYPEDAVAIEAKALEHEESRLWAGANFRSDLLAGDKLGRDVAQLVINRAMTDGSSATWTGSIPTGPGMWTGTNPLLPLWGNVRPWLIQNVTALRPPPPPSVDSAEFQIALQEVRWFSDNRTPEQLQIAQFWADGAGTYTPPGHWNEIACNLLNQRNWSALRDARALALMNMALMDAGICCWDAKYAYWLLRPWQADPAITTPVGKPNFPAYTSGHSTFSGAASEVLGYLFPAQVTQLRAMAEEASMSRVYGGIHYRFDSEVGLGAGRSIARDAGLVNGKKIATFSVARALTDGAPAPTE